MQDLCREPSPDNDLGTLMITACHVIATHHHQSGELSVSTGIRIECELSESGEIGQSVLKVPIQLESTLCCGCVLQRMKRSELRHSRHFLVDFRIILHGAASERIKTRVDTKILIG